MVLMINMGVGVSVNTMTTNNTIANGENNQFGWNSHQKKMYDINNSGFCDVITGNFTQTLDNDFIDSTWTTPETMGGFTNQLT